MLSPPKSQSANGQAEDRLDSWKDIAAYLQREVRTVQLWEKNEGLPVHRHTHIKRGTVYAYKPEIDAWSKSRRVGAATTASGIQTGPPAVRNRRRHCGNLGSRCRRLACNVAQASGASRRTHNPSDY